MPRPNSYSHLVDPLQLKRVLWPDVTFYKQQKQMIYSVWEDDETYVPAGNELGKDFTAAFIALAFFLTRQPVRVVSTSAKEMHLDVLWGEINRFIQRSKYPLTSDKGGPLLVNHRHIRKVFTEGPKKGELCGISYLTGMVASQDTIAAMQGHHATPDTVEEANDGVPRTLFIVDEASSVPDAYMDMAKSWAKRVLVFGNCWPCDNFFRYAVKGRPDGSDRGGDIPREAAYQGVNGDAADRSRHHVPGASRGFHRRIIRIRAEDSPNVRLGLAQRASGRTPTNEVLVPGVKSYADYVYHRRTWDKREQTVRLDADWYEGAEIRLFPKEWLDLAAETYERLKGRQRQARGIGIDPGEGQAESVWTAVDEYGVIEELALVTQDTDPIPEITVEFGLRHGCPPESWLFDRGGGGKQHADRLRRSGVKGKVYRVRSVGFGEQVSLQPKRGLRPINEQVEVREEHYAYKNRRAQMYGELRLLLDPNAPGLVEHMFAGLKPPVSPSWQFQGFGIPRDYVELRRQLAPLPKWEDEEGRLYLPPKQRKSGDKEGTRDKVTLNQLLGCSPDRADALVLAVHAMLHRPVKAMAGIA